MIILVYIWFFLLLIFESFWGATLATLGLYIIFKTYSKIKEIIKKRKYHKNLVNLFEDKKEEIKSINLKELKSTLIKFEDNYSKNSKGYKKEEIKTYM